MMGLLRNKVRASKQNSIECATMKLQKNIGTICLRVRNEHKVCTSLGDHCLFMCFDLLGMV
jgi:hypothetical protein